MWYPMYYCYLEGRIYNTVRRQTHFTSSNAKIARFFWCCKIIATLKGDSMGCFSFSSLGFSRLNCPMQYSVTPSYRVSTYFFLFYGAKSRRSSNARFSKAFRNQIKEIVNNDTQKAWRRFSRWDYMQVFLQVAMGATCWLCCESDGKPSKGFRVKFFSHVIFLKCGLILYSWQARQGASRINHPSPFFFDGLTWLAGLDVVGNWDRCSVPTLFERAF